MNELPKHSSMSLVIVCLFASFGYICLCGPATKKFAQRSFNFSEETIRSSKVLNCASCCLEFLFPGEFESDELATVGEASSLQWIVDLCATHGIDSVPCRASRSWIASRSWDESFYCIVHLRVGHFVIVQGSSDGGFVLDPASLKCFSFNQFPSAQFSGATVIFKPSKHSSRIR
jgi:hypothetical protein